MSANALALEGSGPAHSRISRSRAEKLKQCYVKYLRDERGLAERSIYVYDPYVRDFLGHLVGGAGVIDAQAIRNFLLVRARDRSSSYVRLLTAALRSFLRFLYLRGEATTDLSPAIPRARRRCPPASPAILSREQIEQLLSAPDKTTVSGRRDRTIMLLLARLGLRAGEIVALELDDIHWRTGEIVVRGKGRTVHRLPLLTEIGEALSLYIRNDRGRSESRQVFLRMYLPRTGFTGPAAVGHIVRRALAKTGISKSGRGAAHLFRHSLATAMIRHGASLGEISQILRHRSPTSTETYAKVAFEALREIAKPWPANGKGGAR